MEDALQASYMMVFVGSFESDSVASCVDNNKMSPSDTLSCVCSLSLSSTQSSTSESVAKSARSSERPKPILLNPGERRGWWSKHRYDKRTRMRAVVSGAVEDVDTRILLDTGANVSILSTRLARRLGLLKYARKDQALNIQGISDKKVSVEGQVEVKITLGLNTVYVYTVWISDHQDTSGLILGVDFLMSAGIRLDLYAGKARLPDEVCISLNNVRDVAENKSASRIMVSPTNTMMVGSGENKYFRIRVPKELDQYELWVMRKPKWVPTIIKSKAGVPRYIKITNVSEKDIDLQVIRAREPVGFWVEKGHIPLTLGYVREDSRKYKEWQVLAFEGTTGKSFQRRMDDEFDIWAAENPPLLNKPKPPSSPITGILKREVTKPSDKNTEIEKSHQVEVPVNVEDPVEDPVEDEGLRVCTISVEEQDETETFICMSAEKLREVIEKDQDKRYRPESSQLYAEDLAEQLAMLPDVADLQPEPVNSDDAKIGDGIMTEKQVEKVTEVLRTHQSHLIGGGNALPKPANGVVCDIDVLRSKTKTGAKMDIPYPLLQREYDGYLLSFNGSIKEPTVSGYGSCGYVLWKLPEWEVEYAACEHIPEATINLAEYTGLIRGLRQAVKLGITELFVTGDSHTVLSQVTGRHMYHQVHLQVLLNEVKDVEAKFDRVNYLHLVRKYNGAAYLLASEAWKTQVSRMVVDEATTVMLKKLNKLPEAVYIPADPVETDPTTEQRVVSAAVAHPDLDNDNILVASEVCRLFDQCHPAQDAAPCVFATEPLSEESDSDSDSEGIEIVAIDESQSPNQQASNPAPQNSPSPAAEQPETASRGLAESQPVHFQTYSTSEAVQEERSRRLAHAQDEERQWLNLKLHLCGGFPSLSVEDVKKCEKIAEFFMLLLRYVRTQKQRSQHPDRDPDLLRPELFHDYWEKKNTTHRLPHVKLADEIG